MFCLSTQKYHWLFPNEETIKSIKEKVNSDYKENYALQVSSNEQLPKFLSFEEESLLLFKYELSLREFCKKFNPAMPLTVTNTAIHYFKRFYLKHSVMDYHPREILMTCAYLACKVDEFNVSINQFVGNVKGPQEKISKIILNSELLVISVLDFHLTIHHPYRPVEGFLIDIKTRLPELQNAEMLRTHVDDFLDKIMLTDAPLLYAPSQIALASILHASSKCKIKLDYYITDILVTDSEKLPPIIEAVRTIRQLLRNKNLDMPDKDLLKKLEKKLEKCRNQKNNPESAYYKAKMEKELEDDDDLPRASDMIAENSFDMDQLL